MCIYVFSCACHSKRMDEKGGETDIYGDGFCVPYTATNVCITLIACIKFIDFTQVTFSVY